ncbi:hypothetical protein CSK29544_02303 [Cronobacter sakazakii]|nr:hypothetical protein CSK29544_00006 [Cronobacter sakazakii]AKE95260.1 hypothetical protein CSK29544_02303 [Cronobacter sakazakii]
MICLWWPVLNSGLSVPAASGFTRLVNSPRVPMGHFFPRISLRIHHNGKETARNRTDASAYLA